MKTSLRFGAAILSLTFLVASLQGCGGSDDNEANNNGGDQNASTSPQPNAASPTASGPVVAAPITSFRYIVKVKRVLDGKVTEDYATNGAYRKPDSMYKTAGVIGGKDAEFDTVVIGSQIWLRIGGAAWRTGERSEVPETLFTFTSANSEFLATYPAFLAKLIAKKGKSDSIDGVSMTRYDLDGDDDKKELARVFGTAPDGDAWVGDDGKLTIWIDNTTGHLRRALLDDAGTVKTAAVKHGEISIQIDATDVNAADIAIRPPV